MAEPVSLEALMKSPPAAKTADKPAAAPTTPPTATTAPPGSRTFLGWIAKQDSPTVWAIEVDGEAIGGIGIEPETDVERVSAEIGYWLGESFWGRGIATAALTAVTAEAFKRFEFTRLYALPFADHIASVRVLEKAGYVREGHLQQSAIKDGKIRDQLLFAAYRTL